MSAHTHKLQNNIYLSPHTHTHVQSVTTKKTAGDLLLTSSPSLGSCVSVYQHCISSPWRPLCLSCTFVSKNSQYPQRRSGSPPFLAETHMCVRLQKHIYLSPQTRVQSVMAKKQPGTLILLPSLLLVGVLRKCLPTLHQFTVAPILFLAAHSCRRTPNVSIHTRVSHVSPHIHVSPRTYISPHPRTYAKCHGNDSRGPPHHLTPQWGLA